MAYLKERDHNNISLFPYNETFEVAAKEKTIFAKKLKEKLGM